MNFFFFQQFEIVEKIIIFIELLLFIISGVTSTVMNVQSSWPDQYSQNLFKILFKKCFLKLQLTLKIKFLKWFWRTFVLFFTQV